jgi:hypothetical protein
LREYISQRRHAAYVKIIHNAHIERAPIQRPQNRRRTGPVLLSKFGLDPWVPVYIAFRFVNFGKDRLVGRIGPRTAGFLPAPYSSRNSCILDCGWLLRLSCYCAGIVCRPDLIDVTFEKHIDRTTAVRPFSNWIMLANMDISAQAVSIQTTHKTNMVAAELFSIIVVFMTVLLTFWMPRQRMLCDDDEHYSPFAKAGL